MNNNLAVTIIQFDIIWENKEQNLKYINNILDNNKTNTDIIILPEMFTTGFTMNVKQLAENMNGDTIKWLNEKSQKLNSVIIGSIIINDNNKYFNRLLCVFPNGNILYYDKRHLFRMGNEQEYYAHGLKKLIIDIKGWKIRPLICYDLRFPVWSRNCNDYDLLIYIANWPSSRNEVWEKLLYARAIENQSYAIGVNRIGKDGMNINYSGNSMIIDPKGNIISQINLKENIIFTYTLSKSNLVKFREKFPAYLDADKFKIIDC